MTRLPDATLATLLLTSRLVADGPPPLKAREFWALLDRVGGDPAVLLADVPDDLDEPDRVRGLLDRATAFAFALEDVERTGLTLLSAFDGRYPAHLRERLADQAPPVLHAAGPVELLSEPAVALVAERQASPATVELARSFAVEAAADGAALLTGGSDHGVDPAAAEAALAAEGAVVGLLADALTPQLRRPEARRAIHAGRLCLASPYPPGAPWSEAAERGRLLIATALAERTVALDPAPGGLLAEALADAEARECEVEVVRSDLTLDGGGTVGASAG